MNDTGRRRTSPWVSVPAMAASLLLACAAPEYEAELDRAGLVVDVFDDGSLQITKEQPGDMESMTLYETDPDQPADDEIDILRNCVYIQYCDEPNSPREVICRIRDFSCSIGEISGECIRDADAVCGNWHVMNVF